MELSTGRSSVWTRFNQVQIHVICDTGWYPVCILVSSAYLNELCPMTVNCVPIIMLLFVSYHSCKLIHLALVGSLSHLDVFSSIGRALSMRVPSLLSIPAFILATLRPREPQTGELNRWVWSAQHLQNQTDLQSYHKISLKCTWSENIPACF